VSGIGSTLKPGNDVVFIGKVINNLSFALVPPLEA
jgi:hypothetical protein